MKRVFPTLKFRNPVVLTNAPGESRLFLVELRGKIFSFPNKPVSDQTSADLALDLKQHRKELHQVYGLTFHPNFAKNRHCYICYVQKPGKEDGTRVSRFTVTRSDPPTIIPESEKIIITWVSGGHNGGCLKFGPDGYLYISTGDAVGPFPPDTLRTGQNINDLLASVLRIDVNNTDAGKAYAIPKDNPFVGKPNARGEVWCYGHRNPWKMSFDRKTGELWVGDVGWEMWEMIYRVRKGDNFGWSILEASQSVNPEGKRGPTPIVPPTIAHAHTEARSITGGFVYRGKRLPELFGTYIYGDYVTGKIWGAKHNAKTPTPTRELLDDSYQIICFGEDNAGELYIVGYDGTIHRLEKNQLANTSRRFPRKLSESGLFASTAEHRVANGVLPYSVIASRWMDGASAERFVAIPGEGTIDIQKENDPQRGILRGEWKFPTNSVLMKTISLQTAHGRRRVETQILHRHNDRWNAYNYVWNRQQTDAVLLTGPGTDQIFEIAKPGEKRTIKQTWHHAGRTECLLCHASRGGWVNGFVPEQLDRDSPHSQNQLAMFRSLGLVDAVPKGNRPKLIDSAKPFSKQTLDAAARSYLHVNCSICHRRGGGGTSQFELLFNKVPDDKYLFDAEPTQGTFGVHDGKVIASGDPIRSTLLYRMAKLGRGRMPHVGSNVVDEHGLRLIAAWIASRPAKVPPDRTEGKKLIERLVDLPPGDKRHSQIAARLLAAPETAFQLRLAISQLPPRITTRLATIAIQHDNPLVRDLFEPFLPEDRRTKRLGTVVDAAKLLKITGDVARGKELFFRKSGASCIACHRVGEKGNNFGPDLSQIGKTRSKADLLESILKPSKKIDQKYRTYNVQTDRAKVHTGLLLKRDARELVLVNRRGEQIRIPARSVERIAPQAMSIMPELLFRDMTAQQLADLIAYLASLKRIGKP